MPCNCDMYGAGPFWGTEPNQSGFMGFVDKLWVLLNRIFTILLIIMVILFVVLAIVGWTPVKVLIGGSESFKNRN